MIDIRQPTFALLGLAQERFRKSLEPLHIACSNSGVADGVQKGASDFVQPLQTLSVFPIELTFHCQVANVRQRAYRSRLVFFALRGQELEASLHGHPCVDEPRFQERRILKGLNMLCSV
jgi:hypothetical protein